MSTQNMNSSSSTIVPEQLKTLKLMCTPLWADKQQLCNINTLKSLNQYKSNPGYQLIAKTGSESGLLIIDIDPPKNGEIDGMELMNRLIDKFKFNTYVESSPSGGLHYYFKYYYNDIANGVRSIYYRNKKYSIDILYGKTNCICAPTIRKASYNKNGELKKCAGKYEMVNDAPIIDLPDKLAKFIIKCQNNVKKQSKIIKHNDIPDYDVVHTLVKNLSINRSTDYDEWFNVLACLKSLSIEKKNNELYLSLAHEFSKQCPEKYDEDELNEKWTTITKKRFTIKSLYKWAKEDINNDEKYHKLLDKPICSDDETNIFDSEQGLANIFVKYNKDVIKIIDANYNGYMWSDETKLWETACARDITNAIHPTIIKVGNEIMDSYKNKMYALALDGVNVSQKNDFDYKTTNKDDNEKVKEIKNLMKEYNKKLVMIHKILDKIKTASKRKNVFFIACSQLRDRNFESELDNASLDLIPLKDKNVIDFSSNDGKFIIRERTKQDMFSRTFNVCLPYEEIDGELEIKETGHYDKINNFMLQIMKNDSELLEYFQKLLGYCITPNMDDRSFSIWTGIGSNGKSTVVDIIHSIMGTYSATLNKEVIIKNNGMKTSGQATPHLMALKNAWFGVVNESDRDEELDESQIKNLSGDCDQINIRALYGNTLRIKPKTKIVLLTNHTPRLSTNDSAILDRLKCVPFYARFCRNPSEDEFKSNPEMVNALKKNHVDAFFEWILKGTQRWYANREIVPSRSALEFRKQYVNSNDTLQRFIDNCVERAENQNVKRSRFFELYSTWCTDNGLKPFNKCVAIELFPKKKLKTKKSNGYIVIKDVKINYECEY